MDYKNKILLKQKYDELGSTRRVGKFFGVLNGTIVYWMKKYGLKRTPKLHLFGNNTGKGRLGELYVLGLPFFKNDASDRVSDNDKGPVDITWRNNNVNVKTSHYKRPIFRVKTKRHKVSFYFCLYFNDSISSLIPVEIWIIPSGIAPHSGITPSLMRTASKYHKYKLSLKRGKEFSITAEKRYNARFIKKYGHLLKDNKK